MPLGPAAGGEGRRMSAAKRADVLIVGGGPAGSTLAWTLASHGVRTTVLERTSFPREKVCGDYVDPRGLRILRAMGALKSLERYSAGQGHAHRHVRGLGAPLQRADPLLRDDRSPPSLRLHDPPRGARHGDAAGGRRRGSNRPRRHGGHRARRRRWRRRGPRHARGAQHSLPRKADRRRRRRQLDRRPQSGPGDGGRPAHGRRSQGLRPHRRSEPRSRGSRDLLRPRLVPRVRMDVHELRRPRESRRRHPLGGPHPLRGQPSRAVRHLRRRPPYQPPALRAARARFQADRRGGEDVRRRRPEPLRRRRACRRRRQLRGPDDRRGHHPGDGVLAARRAGARSTRSRAATPAPQGSRPTKGRSARTSIPR